MNQAAFIRQAFPRIKFAFQSHYNLRKTAKSIAKVRDIEQAKLYKQGKPVQDYIFGVENMKQWHAENFKLNKKHYPLIPRFTFKSKIVAFFQNRGGKIHFNHYKNKDKQTAFQYVRYGVIQMDDLRNDLIHWETLIPSTLMQKPFEILINDEAEDITKWQIENLKSAFAFSSLITKQGSSQLDFYQNIAKIPFYSTSAFSLLDRENPRQIVEENLPEFRQIYEPIRQQYFNQFIAIKDNNLSFLGDKNLIRKELFGYLNDNLMRNLKRISPVSYDQDKKIKKIPLAEAKRDSIENRLLERDQIKQEKLLQRGIDKILIAHRNTRIFHIIMGTIFFISFMITKYTIKIFVLYFLYGKHQQKKQKKPQSLIKQPIQQNIQATQISKV